MAKCIFNFDTRAEAGAFIMGIEHVADSAIKDIKLNAIDGQEVCAVVFEDGDEPDTMTVTSDESMLVVRARTAGPLGRTRASWVRLHKDPGGHALFVVMGGPVHPNGRRIIYVCDESGSTPDESDGGAVYIDPYIAKLYLQPSGEYMIADVVVIKDGEKRIPYGVSLSLGCAMHLANEYNLPIALGDKVTTVDIKVKE